MANSTPKKILVCVSGGIAAYKVADVVSLLVKQGHEVQCLMTANASQFVTPTVLETLSGRKVGTALFGSDVSGTEHIEFARWADVILFAPATAHLVARLALGLADDLVTTVALATQAPWVIAPAMNTVMWEKPSTQAHVATLRSQGARIMEPDSGKLACGEVGAGKLPPPEKIVEFLGEGFAPRDFEGKRILITAGPTRSHLDAVRYMTNPSTGKMGAALAEEALARGVEVYYVLGKDKGVVKPNVPPGARFHLAEVLTAEEMLEAALKWLPKADGVIATAAVLDYRVAKPAARKQKRATEPLNLELVPSVDVLGALRERAKKDQWFFGFAAETDSVNEHGLRKMEKKRLDYLFANAVSGLGESLDTGFGTDTNAGVLLRRGAKKGVELPLMSKRQLSRRIFDLLAEDL